MPILLHDASSDGLRAFTSSTSPQLVLGPSHGGPLALAELRHAVVSDVLTRITAPSAQARPAPLPLADLGPELSGACEPETLRYWILSVHYRAALTLEENRDADGTWHFPQLDACQQSLSYLYAARGRLRDLPSERVIDVQTAPAAALAQLDENLRGALEQDLNTTLALLEAQEFALAVNGLCDTAMRKKGRVNVSAVESAQEGFLALQSLLGLCAEQPAAFLRRVRDRRAAHLKLDIATLDRLVAQRAAARAERDFATADRLQAELQAMGVGVSDGIQGGSWTL